MNYLIENTRLNTGILKAAYIVIMHHKTLHDIMITLFIGILGIIVFKGMIYVSITGKQTSRMEYTPKKDNIFDV